MNEFRVVGGTQLCDVFLYHSGGVGFNEPKMKR